VIPTLLLRDSGLVKTTKFRDPRYLGDPRNIVKIFNDKEADELCLLDITATIQKRPPRLDLLQEISSECFMPLAYGGGITTLDHVKAIIGVGVEKVIINTAAVETPALVQEASRMAGSSSVVVSIDVRQKSILGGGGYQVMTHAGTVKTPFQPAELAKRMEDAGAGEILLNSIDRDGTLAGYDLNLVRSVTSAVTIPVIACGGAASAEDLFRVVAEAGASAAAAGSLFVYQGRHRAVLISYPAAEQLSAGFASQP
jgi:cyclase